jgi:tetratricopeptide (TPR) repeat protein
VFAPELCTRVATQRMQSVLHTQRFEVVRRLGSGASGVVYEATNRKSGERVALKALSRLDAGSLYRFKREFRALSGVFHPNLVTLNELFHESGQWYLSMELVHGQSFIDFVRARRPGALARGETARIDAPDLVRLRPALAQLVRALYALHEADRLHRDIKPSNVLVTEQGRVVVLDFGFVRELGVDVVESVEIVGTPAYMAPEQARYGGGQPASDWYAVGVVLFEALTGRLPFEGPPNRVLLEKLERDAPSVNELWPEVPPDLDLLCRELLQRDPALRPRGRVLLERVGELRPTPEPSEQDPFVGRADSLHELWSAFERVRADGGSRVVSVIGPSAIGKTALLERFARELHERGAWVLLGRCHERENVPYKALDGIIDSLVRRMAELREVDLALLLPRYLGALTLQFPVLLRIPAVAHQAARYTRPADPHELRRHASDALHELLARVGDHRSLVLLIDDLQWGDVDSVHMLRDALSPEDMPGILLVAAHREDERALSPALHAFAEALVPLERRGRYQQLPLQVLADSDARELAKNLLATRAEDAELVAHVLRESGGVPLFIHTLTRHVLSGGAPTATLEQLMQLARARVSPAADRLLELIALASAPLPLAVARELAPELDQVLPELVREHLVRQTFHPVETLAMRHEQLRAIVQRRTPHARAVEFHLALARELAAHGAEPELLAYHFLSAGDAGHAASYAARAAEGAARSLAFDSAARCYQLALSWGSHSESERRALQVRMAEALANSGRGGEAGEAFQRAAQGTAGEMRATLLASAVDQLLRAGQLEQGLTLGDQLLRELGLGSAQTGSGALVGLLARRSYLWLRGYEFTARDPVDPRAIARVEAVRAMSHALGHMDPFAAANMQARHLLLALESGDSFSVSRALGYEAVYLAIEGAPHSEKALALLERQRALTPEPTHPYLRAFAHYAVGVVDWGRGRWEGALHALDRAEAAYRSDCTGVAWEILAAQLFSLGCLSFLGEFTDLRKRIVRIADEALARDDRLTMQWIYAWQALADTLRGDAEAAQQSVRNARERLPEDRYTLPHLFVLVATSCASLHSGDGRGAVERIDREWPAIQRGQLLRLQVYRVLLHSLRASALLVAAHDDPGAQRELHRRVSRDLTQLEAEHVPWADAMALAQRGELHLQQGDPGTALASFELAEERLRRLRMDGYAAATHRRIGLLMGGEVGAAQVRAADAWLLDHGVHVPDRVPAILLGGA